MNLYEIKSEIKEILNETDENGEITEDNLNKLSSLTIQRVDKILNLGCLIKNLNTDSEAIYEEIKRLRERKTSIDNNVNRLKEWTILNMKPKEKIEDARVKISQRRSEKCVLREGITIEDLTYDYVRVKKEVDLTALKKDVKNNVDYAVKLAELQDNFSLQIK